MSHSERLPTARPVSRDLNRSVVGPDGAPLILFLHGITASRRYWLPRVLPLADGFRLIVPDLPGFGLSPKPYTDYTLGFYAETMAEMLEREGVNGEPIHVVGHSLGALIGVEMAARFPDRIGRMTLLGLPRTLDPREAHRLWFEGSASYRNLLMANSLGRNLDQIRRTGFRMAARYMRRLPWTVVADCRRFTYRSLTSTLEHCLLNHRVDATLDALPRLPVLLVHGSNDQVAPLERVRGLPDRHPHPTLRIIPGSGHHLIHTDTAICLGMIGDHARGNPIRLASGSR